MIQNVQTINPPTPNLTSRFGRFLRVSKDGLVAFISEAEWNSGSHSKAGRCHVYDWNGSSWVYRNSIESNSPEVNGRFSTSIACNSDGSRVALGNIGNGEIGSVEIWDWNGSSWVYSHSVTAQNGATWYGWELSMTPDGQYLYVGESLTNSSLGVVYEYELQTGTFTRINTISNPTTVDFMRQCAISDDGNTLFTAAQGTGTSTSESGSVMIFTKSGGVWNHQATFTHPSIQLAERFGATIDFNSENNILLVGSQLYDDTTTNDGRLNFYKFSPEDNSLTHLNELIHDTITGGQFGHGCSLSNDGKLLVGVQKANSDDGIVEYYTVPTVTYQIQDFIDTDDYKVLGVSLVDGSIKINKTVQQGVFTDIVLPGDELMMIVSPDIGIRWKTGYSVNAGDKIFPLNSEATPYFFKALNSGTTGSTEPVWDTAVGNNTTDNDITWQCVDNIEQPIAKHPLLPS